MSTTDPQTPSAPSADAERPPEAFPPFTERPPEAEVWRRARQDYLGGDSAPVVAERYGLTERSVRRHAAAEGWRRADVEPASLTLDAPWGVRPPRSRGQIIEENPEYAEIDAARQHDRFNLLFSPDPDSLKGFAFRRACEAASMERPAEAAAWLRVQRLMDQCRDIPDPYTCAFKPDEHLRAALLRAMGRDADDQDVDPSPVE
jgi:hypothetical protein